ERTRSAGERAFVHPRADRAVSRLREARVVERPPRDDRAERPLEPLSVARDRQSADQIASRVSRPRALTLRGPRGRGCLASSRGAPDQEGRTVTRECDGVREASAVSWNEGVFPGGP